MEKIKGNFGFGFMRLPMAGEEVDTAQVCQMVDEFIAAGFNYFDTAHNYLGGKSEIAIRECLTSRYPRESYVLTNKLSSPFYSKTEEIRPLFESQLEICGVDYFDFYLMHAQSQKRFEEAKTLRAYETAFELKAEGKVRHVGFSFHDSPEVLDRILTEYPQFDIVQIQFNYLDLDNPAVQSRGCLEVCKKHKKPVLVMEPVKGGALANLPEKAQSIADTLSGSPASLAIRYAASQEGVRAVLSGMSNLEQLRDNISFMRDFKPICENELAAIEKIRSAFRELQLIPCTGCRYCVDICPNGVKIPDLFAARNAKELYKFWDADAHYARLAANGGKASDCRECGACETMCPQLLKIRDLLKEVASVFEK